MGRTSLSKVTDAKLVYIHNQIPSVEGFTIPIFEKNGKRYVQNSVNGVIEGFDPVEFSDDSTLVRSKNNVVAYVGGEEYVSFFTNDRRDIIGRRDVVMQRLETSAHQYTNPYVLLDIAEFIGDRDLEGEALASINRLRADIDPLSDPPFGNTTLRKRAIGSNAPGSLQKRYVPAQPTATQAAYARDAAMSTEVWVLVGVIGLAILGLLVFSLIGMPHGCVSAPC
jgi:hypothetical protein